MADETSKKPPLQEIATAEKDMDLFNGWITRMENPDAVIRLEGRGKGVRIYEELLRDWEVSSQLQIRSLALQACEWQVDPATESAEHKAEAEFVEKVFREVNFDRLTGNLMHAVVCGYKPAEVMWDASEGQTWIKEFRARRPSRFNFDMAGDLRLLTIQNSFDGEPVPPRKFVTWTFGGFDWNPFGLGLGHQLYWPVFFKKNDIKFWLMFCEKFGSPTPLGKFPPGTSETEQQKLLKACAAIQQETGIVIPQNQMIEFIEAKRAGTINCYSDLVNYMDRAIAKSILGTPLYSEMGASGMGSEGMAQVLDQVRQDILKSDGDSICETINRTVVRWLIDYNFPSPLSGRLRQYPKIWRRTEPEKDLKAQADTDKVLVDMGFEPDEAYINETYGGKWKKKATSALPPNPSPKEAPPEFTERCPHCGSFAEGDPDDVDAQIDRLGTESLPMMDDLITPLRELVMNAKSLEEIRDGLLDLYSTMDPADLGALMEQAMTAAELLGRYEVTNGD